MFGYSITHLAKRLGVDKAIAYSSATRVLQGITGVVSVFFITLFLTGVEQGFYYTFGSILALQVFFELGLTGIMTQYVAHEASHLSLGNDLCYDGDEKYKSRLASLVRFCLKWYSVLSVIIFIFLMIIGFAYFSKYGDGLGADVEWRYPWCLICICTAIKFLQTPFNSILQGLGYVKDMCKLSFWQQFIIPALTWLCLACGFKLYVLGIGYFCSLMLWFAYIYKKKFYTILINLLKQHITERVNYVKEILPYQWRIALSWVSGYFIFQLFNPVLFATEGAVVAGQMGLTLTALNAIQSLSLSWMNTKVPMYSKLIALRQYVQLDQIFNVTLRQMIRICLGLLVLFFGILFLLNISQFSIKGTIYADRFLGYVPTLLMMIPIFLQQYVGSWATYLRCHKKEPFLANSVVNGLLCLCSTFFLGREFGLYGITIGYCCIQLLMFPWGYHIFKTKRAEWHKSDQCI